MRIKLKVAILKSGCKHSVLAVEANRLLPPEKHLTEYSITQIITNRKQPTPKQARAISLILKRPVLELFPMEAKP